MFPEYLAMCLASHGTHRSTKLQISRKKHPKRTAAEAIGAQRSRSLRELNEVLAAGSLAMAFSKTLLGLLTVGAVAVSDLAVSLDLEHEAKPIAKVVSLLESMSNKLEEDQKAPVKLAYKKGDGHLGKSGAVKRAWHFEKDIFICHFDIT